MSLDLLGEGFDLHGGGIDLIFPHHENERAQAVADGREFARHWVHNGWVTVDGTKMSKSLGNFTTLTEFLERHDARAYRLLVLRAHYRSPFEVTPETVVDAEKALDRLDTVARRFSVGEMLEQTTSGYVVEGTAPATAIDADALAAFRTRMDDDLDTPGALADIFDLVSAAPHERRRGRGRSSPRARPDGGGVGRRPGAVVEGRGIDARPRDRPFGGRARRGPGSEGVRPRRRVAGRVGRPGLDRRGHSGGHRRAALNRPHRHGAGADLTGRFSS